MKKILTIITLVVTHMTYAKQLGDSSETTLDIDIAKRLNSTDLNLPNCEGDEEGSIDESCI